MYLDSPSTVCGLRIHNVCLRLKRSRTKHKYSSPKPELYEVSVCTPLSLTPSPNWESLEKRLRSLDPSSGCFDPTELGTAARPNPSRWQQQGEPSWKCHSSAALALCGLTVQATGHSGLAAELRRAPCGSPVQSLGVLQADFTNVLFF